MGCRHYFYLVDKKDVDRVKDKTCAELVEIAKDCGVEVGTVFYDKVWFDFIDDKFMNKTEIHEFGKLYWDDTVDRIQSKGVPLFTNKEAWDCLADHRPYVMGKEGILEAINIYREKIIEFYKSLVVNGETKKFNHAYDISPDEVNQDKVALHISDMLYYWDRLGVVDLDLNYDNLCNSYVYEHMIFELVRLYKNIDWDNKCLIFCGW